MKKLARKLFYSLEKSVFDSSYLVLNDGNYVAHFYCKDDKRAIEKFENDDYESDPFVIE